MLESILQQTFSACKQLLFHLTLDLGSYFLTRHDKLLRKNLQSFSFQLPGKISLIFDRAHLDQGRLWIGQTYAWNSFSYNLISQRL